MKLNAFKNVLHSEEISCIFKPAPRARYNTDHVRGRGPSRVLRIPDLQFCNKNLKIQFFQMHANTLMTIVH